MEVGVANTGVGVLTMGVCVVGRIMIGVAVGVGEATIGVVVGDTAGVTGVGVAVGKVVGVLVGIDDGDGVGEGETGVAVALPQISSVTSSMYIAETPPLPSL